MDTLYNYLRVLREVLPDIISENQSGFVKGRRIAHNIMLCQDMVRGYDRRSAKFACLFKIDLQKAYDSLDWDFLKEMLEALNFPKKFVDLIMDCITTPQFSFSINGALHGYIHARRGLRQGDPISPLFFVIGMECLSRILSKVSKEADFKFHPRCKRLQANISKSAVYGAGMDTNSIDRLVELSGFPKCSLPFKYLGMTICAKRLSKSDCVCLVEKMLVILPKSVLHSIVQVCRAFLWKGVDRISGLGYVSWSDVCRPKTEGGLGFKDIESWNLCAMGKHVWDIASKKDNLWVKWVNAIYIKQDDWWDHEAPIDASWYWKRIVQVKNRIKAVFSFIEFQKFNYTIAGMVSKVHLIAGRWKFNMIWDRFSIPKHRFIIWLALLERLPTFDRIQRFKSLQSVSCVLCGKFAECHAHLFFSCSVSAKILVETLQWSAISYHGHDLKNLLKWIGKNKLSQGRRKIVYSIISTVVYFIWHSRNSMVWDQKFISIDVIVRNIIHCLKLRLQNMNLSKLNRVDIIWVDSLLRVCN
ncbi:uncharacterized protein LOC133823744 [Humulus lupulus]|uniref:uncharacterized protein LOC133823744 n=1 Tax=Humulus lupulus TaxID=3486 RepID=UPI002B415831|nr:uncharacterized protein LOC133823744 [Humulus lupulus]